MSDFSAASGFARFDRHLVLRIYDDVIEVLCTGCTGFTVAFGVPRDVSPVDGEE